MRGCHFQVSIQELFPSHLLALVTFGQCGTDDSFLVGYLKIGSHCVLQAILELAVWPG